MASAWSAESLPHALAALIQKAGIGKRKPGAGRSSTGNQGSMPADGAKRAERLEWEALLLGCEAQPIHLAAGDLQSSLPGLCPALLQIGPDSFLAAVRMHGSRLELVSPNGKREWKQLADVCRAIRAAGEVKQRAQLSEFVQKVSGEAALDEHVVEKLAEEQLAARPCAAGWWIRELPVPGIRRFVAHSGVARNAAVLITAHFAQYSLWLLSWWILGRLSFEGHMDRSWLIAWSLLLLTVVPLRVLGTYAQGTLAIGAGAALKRHLLRGTLRLPQDEIRKLGTGGVLSQIFESEAVETLALSGGIGGCLALLELLVASVTLGWLALLLIGFCGVAAWTGRRFWRRYQRWTATRMEMSNQLVEAMVGQRTRVAQELNSERHRFEDRQLETYLSDSRGIDRSGSWLIAAIPRGWLVGALIGLAPAAVSGTEPGALLALHLGGVLLAFTALQKLNAAAVDMAATAAAALRIASLFQAASNPELVGALPPDSREAGDVAEREPRKVVELDRLTFRYPGIDGAVLESASLIVNAGERLLLQGPSGGGKSTLAALLSGLREPSSGLVLAGGLDRFTLGERGWRKRVANAPQFHDNHILSGTLAFNLLMGRPWPPSPSDLADAESVCRELALGDLMDRMPAGLSQMVGEGGWQLSQGERSRVFLARALLQGADLTILDESFGALDPETLQCAMDCVLERTNALLVIAHP